MTRPPFDAKIVLHVHRQYRLGWHGTQGASHWARVLENGLRLCEAMPELRRDVVVLFALLHYACRHDDGHGGEHGHRSAMFAGELHRAGHLELDGEGLSLLTEACRTHTGGRIPADPTVMAYWDSDRLDLPRIRGLQVRSEWLGTAAAREPETVAWATQRARSGAFPWEKHFASASRQTHGKHSLS